MGKVTRAEVCAACNSEQAIKIKDLVTKNGVPIGQVVRCPKCGLVSVDPMPPLDAASLEGIYGEKYWQTYCSGSNYVTDPLVEETLAVACDRQLALFEQYTNKGKMLDFGCADGKVLAAATSRGWDAYGVDVSAYAIDHAKAAGLKAFCGELSDFVEAGSDFDMITMSHVIEHLPRPIDQLVSIRKRLKDGGLLVVETDNSTGPRRWFDLAVVWLACLAVRPLGKKFRTRGKQRYHILSPPEHVHTFGAKSLKTILSLAGFEVIRIICPAHGNSCFYPHQPGKRRPPFRRLLDSVDWVGEKIGLGSVIVVLARAKGDSVR